MENAILKKAKVLFLITIMIGLSSSIFAQSWNLPDNRKNNRIYTDQFEIPRPALSIRGFDNTKIDNFKHQYSTSTYGVRQVLEKAYGINGSKIESVGIVFETIVNLSTKSFERFTTDNNRDRNSRILESRAFVALMSFIIDNNSSIFNDLPNLYNVPSHEVAIDSLRAALLVSDKSRYFRKNISSSNPFKRSVPLMKVARAWDLYLALENAYEDMGGNLDLLLTQSDKLDWIEAINGEMQTIWEQTFSEDNLFADLFNVNNHEVQPGNWPLISFVSLGYVALGFHGPFTSLYDDQHGVGDLQSLNDVFSRAMKSAAFHYTDTSGRNERFNYYWFQTNGGKDYWAEGAYYFEVTLPRLLSFWHAVRANNKLGSTSHGDGIDPFNYNLFNNTLQWHAKIATPDGRTSPFDDGNKKLIRSASLLSWNSTYGNAMTGKLFAHIRDLPDFNEVLDIGSYGDYRLIEIAIPRLEKNQGTPPNKLYGNSSSSEKLHQQSVFRYTDNLGRKHYLFMNGEFGKAITNSEGHEQPDQLQLLYYVDENSYLKDSGYDQASPKSNSSWNGYFHHNTMALVYIKNEEYITGHVKYQNDGGLESPRVNVSETRKISDHEEIIYNYIKDFGKVKKLQGKINIHTKDYFSTSSYVRNVLFIEDPVHPYLIDLNSIKLTSGSHDEFVMTHHLIPVTRPSLTWKSYSTSADCLNTMTMPVEFDPDNFESNRRVIGTDRVGSGLDYITEIQESFEGEQATLQTLANSNGEPIFNTVTIINIDNSPVASVPTKIFSYDQNNKTAHQGWYWIQDSKTVDVIIKRSMINSTKYNQHLDFE